MDLVVLHVTDCPNLAVLLGRLATVTSSRIVTRMVETDVDAARYGMAGSPTLLVDGVDPFRAPGDHASGLSCRIYRNDDGGVAAAPSVEQLRAALGL